MIHEYLALSQKHIIKIIAGCIIIACSIILLCAYKRAQEVPALTNIDTQSGIEQAKYHDSSLSIEERVKDLLSHMTREEKIGQLALVEKNSVHDLEDIGRYGIGAMLSGAGAKPDPNTPEAWLQMVNEFQTYAQKTRLKIPLLYGVDAIHGHAGVLGATVFPHQIGLGAANDFDLVRKVNAATARELVATGIYWNFSPSLDVTGDIRWGRTYETFGGNNARVTALGGAAVEGLQQKTPSGTLAVLSTGKHYIGTGAMVWGKSSNKDFKIDQGEVNITEKELRAIHLPPFQKAVDSGVMSIMMGLQRWQGKKLSTNEYLITDVLKKELGFTGFVVSDWYGVYEITGSKYDATVTAINAGIDMVMLPFDYKGFVDDVSEAITRGDITEERLDDAVSRILRVKFALGLFDRPLQDESQVSIVGSKEHRDLAREAVRKSLVLLKNKNRLLPLDKTNLPLLVAGTAADNVGQQSGAWTVEWQGINGNWLPGGTSILEGIRQAVSKKEHVIFDEKGDFTLTQKAPIGVAIVGEKPYAEGWGDKDNLQLSSEDLEIIRKVKAASEKIIVIIISGRPLDIKKEAESWDAVVAAWLPGSEGQGVADVLFGEYEFTGTLPLPWDM
jgi:beta-glucosidase